MKKAFVILFAFFVTLVVIAGCAKSNPTTPEPTATNTPTATATATGLFVEEAAIVQAQSSHGVGSGVATFILRYGNSTGAYVQGATITIGTGTLVEGLPGHYSKTFSNTGDGVSVSVSISSLAGNASSSLITPYDGAIITPSSDGANQSAAASYQICQQFCITTCTMPQSVELYVWRLSDHVAFVDQTSTPPIGGNNYDSICWTINANTLPNSGQIYMRAYGINSAAIVGANGGSSTFKFFNSENQHYINMQP